jgi:hypothetical protein
LFPPIFRFLPEYFYFSTGARYRSALNKAQWQGFHKKIAFTYLERLPGHWGFVGRPGPGRPVPRPTACRFGAPCLCEKAPRSSPPFRFKQKTKPAVPGTRGALYSPVTCSYAERTSTSDPSNVSRRLREVGALCGQWPVARPQKSTQPNFPRIKNTSQKYIAIPTTKFLTWLHCQLDRLSPISIPINTSNFESGIRN